MRAWQVVAVVVPTRRTTLEGPSIPRRAPGFVGRRGFRRVSRRPSTTWPGKHLRMDTAPYLSALTSHLLVAPLPRGRPAARRTPHLSTACPATCLQLAPEPGMQRAGQPTPRLLPRTLESRRCSASCAWTPWAASSCRRGRCAPRGAATSTARPASTRSCSCSDGVPCANGGSSTPATTPSLSRNCHSCRTGGA